MKRLLSLLLAASMFLSLPVYSQAEDGTELLSEVPAEEQTDVIPAEDEEPVEEPEDVSEEEPVRDVLTEEEILEKDALYAENVELRTQSVDAPVFMNAGTADSGTFGDGLTWSFENNTLTISGEGAIPDNRNNSYPWYSYRRQIYTISIGKDITYIPLTVLETCYALDAISVEEGNLAYTVSDNVLFDREMHMLVYYPGALAAETYHIPSTVTELGQGALADASQLTALTIPASVISIPENSLPYYGDLESVTVESGSKAYCAVDGVLYDKNQSILMLYPPQKKDTSFVIPERLFPEQPVCDRRNRARCCVGTRLLSVYGMHQTGFRYRSCGQQDLPVRKRHSLLEGNGHAPALPPGKVRNDLYHPFHGGKS